MGVTMLMGKRGVRAVGAALVAGAALGAAVAPASAWPIPLEPGQVNFLNATRGNFPGDDDQVLMAGLFACRLLYTGQSSSAAADSVAAQYGGDPGQAAAVVHAARGNLCTQAPG
jgi:hypothetical protein